MNPKKIILILLFAASLIVITFLVTNANNFNVNDAQAASASTNIKLFPLAQSDVMNQEGTTITSTKKSFIGSGNSTDSWFAVRFPINQKVATITKALLGFYVKDTQWIGLSTDIYIENTSDSQPLTTTNKASTRKLTSSKITYNNDIKWQGGSYSEIDITRLVQEALAINPNIKSFTVIIKNTSGSKFARKFFESDFSNSTTRPYLNLSTTQVVTIPTQPSPVPNPVPIPNPVPTINNTVFVAPDGNDSNNGSSSAPFKTIQNAINYVNSNKTNINNINVRPGVYRESPEFRDVSGSSDKPITITSDDKSNLANIYGSESSQDSRINWQKGTDGLNFPDIAKGNVYFADVSVWNASPEIAFNSGTRINKAMEPDIDPFADTSVVDNRWTAQGGSGNNGLIDKLNLKNINGFTGTFLIGARVFVVDGYSGHDQNTGIITAANVSTGQISLDKDMKYFDGRPLITTNSKYYVEGKAELLDNPGEWFYDISSKKLYIWAPNSDNPNKSSIEFGVRSTGFRVTNSQNIIIKDINVKFVNYAYGRSTGNDGAVYIYNRDDDQTSNVTIDNVNIKDVGFGIRIFQSTNKRNLTQNINIKNSSVEMVDGIAFMAFNFPYLDSSNNYIPGVKNVVLDNNHFKKGGYRPVGNGDMMWTQKIQNLTLKNNLIEESAHNGIEIQVSPDSNVLVQNNTFKNNCLSGSDCGGFKIWGGPLTARNVLVVNNIAIGTKGCSFASKASVKWITYAGNGCGGFGLYTDGVKPTNNNEPSVIFYENYSDSNYYSGIHITKSSRIDVLNNIVSNNSFGLINSISTNAGERLEGSKILDNIFSQDSSSTLNLSNYSNTTKVKYNYGLSLSFVNESDRNNIQLDRNIYQLGNSANYDVYTRLTTNSTQLLLKSVGEIQSKTVWEKAGKDIGNESTIPTPQGFSTTLLRQNFGYSTSTPQDVLDMISRLQQAGISTNINNTVGKSN